LPGIVSRQACAVNSVYYLAHRGSFVLQSESAELGPAGAITDGEGVDILNAVETKSVPPAEPEIRSRSAMRTYTRNAKVRAVVLEMAAGKCECCGVMGFLTMSGEHYLETHHVVGVAERGPDSKDNIVALCPLCHRKAHYSAERVAVERRLLEALRRRVRKREMLADDSPPNTTEV
jgi:hypothetical protein